MKIAIIGVYFGPFPDYFSLWLESCRKNKEIDFYIFTDQKMDIKEENIKFIPYSLKKMKDTAGEKLNLKVSLDSPYKCCDFKPVFGIIFDDYISQYDYWGHCDFDMIFGDLMSFFKKNELNKYDKFLPLGHLSLYRNTIDVNNRYKCPGAYVDYKTVFTSNQSYAFDEFDGMAKIYRENNFPFFGERVFADIDQKHKRFRLSRYCVPKNEKTNWKYQVFYWDNGKVFRKYIDKGNICKDEYIYIHFQKRKNMEMKCGNKSSSYYITNTGFYENDSIVTKQKIIEYNPPESKCFEMFEELYFYFKLQRKRLRRLVLRVLRK